ncbi:DEAD/DEAH box helicase [Methylomonas sp. AM2-LC]|uniref:DEAD/DEAH box helicase n=1 Tax=Methylomonas sp. AM2-LC TaxID=3153301 RepID=UPI0032639EC8
MSLGEITYNNGHWNIVCEPHVRTKLKRLFPEIDQRAGDLSSLSDNEENCRDLLWFLDRYPMKVDRMDYMTKRSEFHVEQENQVAALLNFRNPPNDFELAFPARDYQKIAATLAIIKKGVLVADDLGLGKTVTGICLLAIANNLPALVVTMSHLVSQWENEINRFAPLLKTHALKTGKTYDLIVKTRKKGCDDKLPDVIICNYHKLHGWSDVLSGLVPLVIFDEAQELRRHESNKYAAAKHIAGKANLVMGLSATPIYNQGHEFFNVIDCIRPRALGTRPEFLREWCGDGESIKDPRAFGEYLRREGLMIRRTRKEVGRELPPIIKIPQYVDCDSSKLDSIKGAAVELAKIILANQQQSVGAAFHAAQEFNIMMRQATGIAKAPYVAEFVRMLLESGEKVILFGWHREVYNIWLERLYDFKPVMYTGTESAKQKDAAKNAFIYGESQLMIVSLRSGAGLDGLQSVCWTVVKGELDYSPAVHDQCIGRAARDGQENTVMAHYLISENGSDPIIADILGIKRGQIEGVINPNDDLIEHLEVDPGYIKRLASDYLTRAGVSFDGNR